VTSLWDYVISKPGIPGVFHGRTASVARSELVSGSTLDGKLESLRGRSVLLSTDDQLGSALALLELDGVARRVVLCTPDLTAGQLGFVSATAECDAVVSDRATTLAVFPELPAIVPTAPARAGETSRKSSVQTEWILLTSGTTGTPKLVVHTLDSLGSTLPRQAPDASTVWSTFYDIRRYGGLQIYLRAVLSGTSLVLSSSQEGTPEFFARGAALGVTHISGTPSHWRRALMSGSAAILAPKYVRLSGEIADQTVLDKLQAAYPSAAIGHAFASTEAGVGFEVNDGLAGFPADYIGRERNGIEMKVVDGTLRLRSNRTAARYLGEAPVLADTAGFVDTGDLVDLQDGRYYFKGRKTGVINVGGLKVHPEEVESVLNADRRVRVSLVRARRNPIVGSVVVADVVLTEEAAAAGDAAAAERVKAELLEHCRRALPVHKVPTALRFVPALELTAAGKLVRPHA
jgi:acyl-coenzyme A synthetase/AMP-(fatty) acid ligase